MLTPRTYCARPGRARWMLALVVSMTSLSMLPVTTAAQGSASSSDANPPPKIVTLTGCLERGATPDQFSIADAVNGTFQLSGFKLSKYVGQRVQLAGSVDRSRLKIKGGLWPNPNMAGQGRVDPVKTAIAAMPGGTSAGTGGAELPTFKVKSVRTLSGGCG